MSMIRPRWPGLVTPRRRLAAAGVVALAIFAAACGGTSTSSTSSTAASGTIVRAVQSPYGKVLVDAGGMTLYAYSIDSPGVSRCSGECNKTWPPLVTTGAPRARGGVDGSLLSTFKRSGGATQVSYAGHPLYTYTGDTVPGEYRGQGLGNLWHVVSISGRVIDSTSPTTPTTAVPTTLHPSTTTTARPPSTTTTTHPSTTTTTTAPTTTTHPSTTTTTTAPTTTTTS